MTREPHEKKKMPLVFLPHGGGPWPFMDDEVFGMPGMWDAMRDYMEKLGVIAPAKPRALLVVSAHWEAPEPTVMTSAKPPMLYDYSGFPKETYEIEYPAPGAPEIAARVQELLRANGIKTAIDPRRGFDHGVFVPLMLAYPDAGIPTFQLSLVRGLDPKTHIAIGRAIAPLREEGVFIIGSGMSYHNLRALLSRGRSPSVKQDSYAFDTWLTEAIADDVNRRERLLVEWEQAPAARASHPREEHLLPLHVIVGAAGDDPGHAPYRDVVMGAHVSAAHFG